MLFTVETISAGSDKDRSSGSLPAIFDDSRMTDLSMQRREFLLAGAALTAGVAGGFVQVAQAAVSQSSRNVLVPFDYQGVRLRESRWQKQFQDARDFYRSIPDDDILHGYRRTAGLNAPGKPLGGWCAVNSNTVFGQWLSGMVACTAALPAIKRFGTRRSV